MKPKTVISEFCRVTAPGWVERFHGPDQQDIEPRQAGRNEMVASSAIVSQASKGHGVDALGERLRSLRTARGLTIIQLAELAGVSSGLISQIERGNSNPSIKTL